jgi:carbamoyl-phosphate synthase large subunit
VLPPFSLADDEIEQVKEQTEALARELKVVGLINIQFAVRNEVLYVLEVNPRASRTVPFVSKAIGVPLAKLAARVMAGKKLDELGFTKEVSITHTAVKCPVFPFSKLVGSDPVLGPEMKSTGEVMGIDYDFGRAFAKAYKGAGHRLPTSGTVFLSVKNKDKRDIIFIARTLRDRGFRIVATHGTATVLGRNGIEATTVYRISDAKPNVLDLLAARKIDLIINTPSGKVPKEDHARIRRCALENDVPLITTIQGAMAAVGAIESLARGELSYHAIQDYYGV